MLFGRFDIFDFELEIDDDFPIPRLKTIFVR